jgi:hypothetical protein
MLGWDIKQTEHLTEEAVVRILNRYGSILVTDASTRTGMGLESASITAVDPAPDGGALVTAKDRGRVHVAESPEEIRQVMRRLG